eukprot:604346-Hanusia_phi.AAC.1
MGLRKRKRTAMEGEDEAAIAEWEAQQGDSSAESGEEDEDECDICNRWMVNMWVCDACSMLLCEECCMVEVCADPSCNKQLCQTCAVKSSCKSCSSWASACAKSFEPSPPALTDLDHFCEMLRDEAKVSAQT